MRICLDTGHANAYSEISIEAWIKCFGEKIGHVHLHNNHGMRDEHNALEHGSLDMADVLGLIRKYAPEADICIESMDAAACIEWLEKKGYIDVQSL